MSSPLPDCARCGTPCKTSRQTYCSKSCAQKARMQRDGMRSPWGRAVASKAFKRPDLDNVYFRSAWEANYARYLNLLRDAEVIADWEYEPERFEFPVKRGNRWYLPDFKVYLPGGGHEWHEVKGYMDNDSKVKIKRFCKYYPSEKLVIIDAKTYAAIAREHGHLIEGWE